MSTRMLVVWYPDWGAVASGRPPSEPVAVVAANRVVAVSGSARAEGVDVGLRRREAQGRCPGLTVVAADPAAEARAWEAAVAAVATYSPEVEILRAGSVAMATRGPSRYFGGDRALATKVVEAVDGAIGRSGCRVGVADGRFTAEWAARAGSSHGPDAGGRVTLVPPGQSASWLASRPVSTLGMPELSGLLVRLGLGTLGDLAALPAASVLARFGTEGALAHRLARGWDDQPLAARTPPPDLAVTAVLDPPAERVDTAAFIGKALADELHDRLGQLGLACTRVSIEAETEHGEELCRRWRHDGALTSAAIADRVRWQLDGWLASGGLSGGLTLLRLVPDEVRPDNGRQLGFWGGSSAVEAQVSRSLARVQGLLGPDAVVTATLVGGRDPRQQVRWVPWGEPRPVDTSGPRDSGAPWPGRMPDPAPAVVHQRPWPASLCDVEGRPVQVTGRGVVTAAPATLTIEGPGRHPHLPGGRPQLKVTAWAGPWPVDERWWDRPSTGLQALRGLEGQPGRRARFQVMTEGGAAYLISRAGGQWWVEASYD